MKYNKFKGTKEELENQYCLRGKAQAVADYFGVKKSCILYWMKKWDIAASARGGGNLIDLTGQRFGSLVVQQRVKNSQTTAAKWLCQCDCGGQKEVVRNSLVKGLTTSCGCKKFNILFKGHGQLSGCYWSRIMKGAVCRNLEWDLTIVQAWELFQKQGGKCAISGLEIKLVTDYTRRHEEHTASLDRIENSKGYTLDNVQWVHRDINMMRRAMPLDYFKWLCTQIGKFNSSLQQGISEV
jgi:hypothetical protein